MYCVVMYCAAFVINCGLPLPCEYKVAERLRRHSRDFKEPISRQTQPKSLLCPEPARFAYDSCAESRLFTVYSPDLASSFTTHQE